MDTRRGNNKRLVTVGVPTFNRPSSLKRALQSILAQTFGEIEVIVSDNASPDPSVEAVVRRFADTDDRVCYIRQPQNLGPMGNFSFLVGQSKAPYFMWAADDDCWVPFFIERCVERLTIDSSLAVCQMEAQYELSNGELFPFFPEGTAFYNGSPAPLCERLQHLARNTYGNLVYGVFRREALLHQSKPITDWIGLTLNEIPMQMLFAAKGRILVLPEIGMYKTAPGGVCEQAQWEQTGGRLKGWHGLQHHFADALSLSRYHRAVRAETFDALASLGLDSGTLRSVKATVARTLRFHQLSLVLRWKPRRKARVG